MIFSSLIIFFQLNSWSVNKTGHKVCSYELHSDTSEAAQSRQSYGKRFTFNNDGNYMLTCGPLGGIIYEVRSFSYLTF